MLAGIISLFTNFIHLILGINTPQNFPPPLPPDEERKYFLRAEAGDTEARKKLISYAEENNLELTGVFRNIYLEGPPQHKDKSKFITQIIAIIE